VSNDAVERSFTKDYDDKDDQPDRRCLRNDERGRDNDSMTSDED